MTKEPKDWTFCSVCDKRYGFINCRVTTFTAKGPINRCISCAIAAKKTGGV